jgi:hypothetical protein
MEDFMTDIKKSKNNTQDSTIPALPLESAPGKEDVSLVEALVSKISSGNLLGNITALPKLPDITPDNVKLDIANLPKSLNQAKTADPKGKAKGGKETSYERNTFFRERARFYRKGK